MFYDGTAYHIYRGLFHNCPLETLYLGRDIEYKIGRIDDDDYNSPFYENKTLATVTIGSNVTHIATEVFKGCSRLTSVSVGNSVSCIGEGAFYGCSGLTSTSITIPNTVTSIGKDAFYGCSGLTSVTIPKSVESVDFDAFWNCI